MTDKPENPSAINMTLLDFFAGQALAGLLTRPGAASDALKADQAKSVTIERAIAALCYDLAEAMLAEREKRA